VSVHPQGGRARDLPVMEAAALCHDRFDP